MAGELHSKVIRALIRSKNRTIILRCLSNSGREMYLEEIVKETGMSHSNMLGALFGDDKNYSKSFSLTGLGLVEVLEDEGYRYYKITATGLRSIHMFKT